MEKKGYKYDFSKFISKNYASDIMCQQNDNLTSPTQQSANQSYPVQEYPVQGANIAPMPNQYQLNLNQGYYPQEYPVQGANIVPMPSQYQMNLNQGYYPQEYPVQGVNIVPVPNQYQLNLNQGYYTQKYPVQATITGLTKPVFDTIIGEYIISDAIKNNMSAVSGKNNKVKKRLISVGIIKECKIIHYISNGEHLNYYIIKTLGSDCRKYEMTLSHNEFDGKNLLDILAAGGKISFVRSKRDKDECELIRKYIINIADKDDFEYPEFIDWINGKYITVGQKYNIETPFFKHIVRCGNMDTTDAAEGLLNNLNIFSQPKHRLFFLILLHYIVIQRLVPTELRWKKPIYIHSDSELIYVINAVLGIFGDNEIISLSLSRKRIENEMYMARGTMIFLEIPEYGDGNLRNVSDNVDYINAELNLETTVIILCKMYGVFSESAFNISLKEDDVSKGYVNKSVCGEHIRHFADWICENDINVGEVQADNWIELTYALVKRYFKNCGLPLEIESADSVVQNLLSESENEPTGEWITEWLRENILKLKNQNRLNIIDLNADEVRLSDEKPNICKKGGLICFKEDDLKLFIKLCGDSQINIGIVKESLLRADTLDRDNNRQTYQKNIYVRAYNRCVRMIAVIYDRIFPTGYIGI